MGELKAATVVCGLTIVLATRQEVLSFREKLGSSMALLLKLYHPSYITMAVSTAVLKT